MVRGVAGGAVLALVVEDPRVQNAFSGGVFVVRRPGRASLAPLLRDLGTAAGHAGLASAPDFEAALAQLRVAVAGRRSLVVVEGATDVVFLRPLWRALGADHRVLISTDNTVPDSLPAVRLGAPARMRGVDAEAVFLGFGGEAARSVTGRAVAQAVRRDRRLVAYAGRLVGSGFVAPADLLSTIGQLPGGELGLDAELSEGLIDTGLRGTPPSLRDAVVKLSALPALPASLPESVLRRVVGTDTWRHLRDPLVAVGWLTPAGMRRYALDPLVMRVARRYAVSTPERIRAARSVLRDWAVERVVAIDGPVRLWPDRRAVETALAVDPVGTLGAAGVSFDRAVQVLGDRTVRAVAARAGELRGHPWEGPVRGWLVDQLVREGRRRDARRLLRATYQDAVQQGDVDGEIASLLRLDRLRADRGRLVPARESLETALHRAAATGRREAEAAACVALAEVLDLGGETKAAVAALWRAGALFEALGQVKPRVDTLLRLGQAAPELGQLGAARMRCEEALALAESASDVDSQAEASAQLGAVALHSHDAATARKWLRRALSWWDDHGAAAQPRHLLRVLAGLARASEQLGHTDDALAFARRRIEDGSLLGDWVEESQAIADLARQLAASGARRDAMKLVTSALARARALGDKRGEATQLLAAGAVHGPRVDPPRAVVCFEAARIVAEDIGWRSGLAQALDGICSAEAAMGQLGAALRDGRAALEIYRGLGDPAALARAQLLMGGLLIATGADDEGRAEMASGARRLAQLGWPHHEIAGLVDGSAALSIGA